MAYIDTNELFKCETCRHCIGEYKCDTYCDSGECYSPNMSKLPTADVVPKSEVDKLKIAYEGSQKTIKGLTETIREKNKELAKLETHLELHHGEKSLNNLIAEEKSEVAREIFAEIDSAFAQMICEMYKREIDAIQKGDITKARLDEYGRKVIEIAHHTLSDALKKKYTEEKT